MLGSIFLLLNLAGTSGAMPTTTTLTAEPRDAALACLATAIVHEAGREPPAGQAAVARVVLNRVAHPVFPKTVCEVVYQGSTRRSGCQFTFTCDGSLRRTLPPAMWTAAREIAALALDGIGGVEVGGATHYHATYVTPYWASTLSEVATIGLHRFYRIQRAGGVDVAAPRTSEPTVITVWGLAVGSPRR